MSVCYCLLGTRKAIMISHYDTNDKNERYKLTLRTKSERNYQDAKSS